MRRFAVPLAVFVLANGALVLFNQYRLSQMKGRVCALEAERAELHRALDQCRAELEEVSSDLCATELRRLQVERENRRIQDEHFGPVKARVTDVLEKGGFVLINRGTSDGIREGMEFFLFREDRYVASAVVRGVDGDFAVLSIKTKLADPESGDAARTRAELTRMRFD